MMRTYTLFAGVNGAGKTSIYKSVYYKNNKNEARINTDEMVARIGSWQDDNLQMKCAREAVKLIRRYFNEGISFNQETTLSGKSIIRNILTAKEKGFFIHLNYIGLESVEIAKQRIRHRVNNGGHGIFDEAVERRYVESFSNLQDVIPLCDVIDIYDNTDKLRLIMSIENGRIVWKDKYLPKWCQKL